MDEIKNKLTEFCEYIIKNDISKEDFKASLYNAYGKIVNDEKIDEFVEIIYRIIHRYNTQVANGNKE